MTVEFFEGGAGTGKTYCLIDRATEIASSDALAEQQRLLALTFMNGARQRLDARLAEKRALRGKFECQTFDVFARRLVSRRRSLLVRYPVEVERAAGLNEFNGPCLLATVLLTLREVQEWVARTYPLVVVDEAQDLDAFRLGILRGLATHCHVLVAADAFQCLTDGANNEDLMGWLQNADVVRRLTQPRRTDQPGILSVAAAVREGKDIFECLAPKKGMVAAWSASGIRLVEVPAKNAGYVGWAIACELARRNGQVAILTPDSRSPLLRDALEQARTRLWEPKGRPSFGPFPFKWETHDKEAVSALVSQMSLPAKGTIEQHERAMAPLRTNPAIAVSLAHMRRKRKVVGQVEFTDEHVCDVIADCVRDQRRYTLRESGGRTAMTIQRAKNREFASVVVLWPHSVVGSSEQLRRLLYNGVTRAVQHCSIVVFGVGRLKKEPFRPGSND